MTLCLTDREHYGLQQFFLQLAPGIPPIEVHMEMLGIPACTGLEPSCDDWAPSVGRKAKTAPECTTFDNAEDDATSFRIDNTISGPISCSETVTGATVNTSGASSRGYPLALGVTDDKSIWKWTSDDEKGAATQGRVIASGNQAPQETRKHISPEQIVYKTSGDLQPKALGITPGPVVTSVDDALCCIQEVKCFSEVESAINAVTSWAATASSCELQEFNRSCETYPYIMWAQPYLPQLDYSELLSVLPYIKQDYKRDGRKSTPYINLEAAHLFGVIWSTLYTRGVITLKTYSDGLLELVRSNTYTHWDILDTILTTRLDESNFASEEMELAQHLTEYRDHVRDNKIRQLEKISKTDSEEWQ